MVQKTNQRKRLNRSASAGLALVGLICSPVLAQQSISSSAPVTRISRPNAGGQAPGAEIKLMPAQPVVDPLTPPQIKGDSKTDFKPSAQPNTSKPAAASKTGADGFPPVAPPINKSQPAPPGPGGEDPYPTIGKLEGLTLGAAQPTMPITDRLARLEHTVYKRVYNDDSLTAPTG